MTIYNTVESLVADITRHWDVSMSVSPILCISYYRNKTILILILILIDLTDVFTSASVSVSLYVSVYYVILCMCILYNMCLCLYLYLYMYMYLYVTVCNCIPYLGYRPQHMFTCCFSLSSRHVCISLTTL